MPQGVDHTRRTVEPLLWLLFSAGGVLAALLIPVLLLLFGLAFPLGWLSPPSHAHLLSLLHHPITRAVLFLVCSLALFHWAHRFRYTLYDGLQIKHLNELINLPCYGGAVAGSAVAGYLLWQVP
jgi:succinate dehydrogenase subunit D